LADWARTEYIAVEAAHTQRLIDLAYERIAGKTGKSTVGQYVAEKAVPGRHAWIARRLYPGAKEIFLVRDLRDVFCSIVAFNTKRGYRSFGMEEVADDAEYLVRLRAQGEALRSAWRRRCGDSILVRYEDLIVEPTEVAKRILAYLELPASDADATTMVASASVENEALRDHRTTGSGGESVGRWRRDMPIEMWEGCAAALDDLLAEFGYEPTLER
jgi:hypothetical protein